MEQKNTIKFVSIEGGDGAGKSTYIPRLKEYLESLGETVVLTREPGGTPLGEELRKLFTDNHMSVLTETLILEAARSDHIENVIRPALNKGHWVICDRFSDSTFAYQCSAKGLPEAQLKQLEQMVHKDINPSMTFFFNVPLKVSKERLLKHGKELDRFEIESDDFKNAVVAGYKTLVKRNPGRYKLVDSSQSIEDTTEQVMGFFKEFVEGVLAENQEPSQKKRLRP